MDFTFVKVTTPLHLDVALYLRSDRAYVLDLRSRSFPSAALAGYFIGAFPTADIVPRRASGGTVNLRTSGTGNPGGANALKVLGKRAGYTVMAGDIAKGALASGLGGLLAGPAGAHLGGTSSVVGHCFPVWSGFHGGKGVATSVGQCLATFPAYFPIDIGVAAAVAANPRLKQRTFTATSISCAVWVLGGLVWWRKALPNLWGPAPSPLLPLFSAISSGVIVYRFIAERPS